MYMRPATGGGTMNTASAYDIKRDGAWYTVVCKSTGLVHYRSLKRINCKDYIAAQEPQEEEENAD
jgi:hypothetical protein